ncbi:MAG: HD domain-containing protein [Tepidiformaceae bacterium]
MALTRLACLLHDVAKPHTAATVDGRLRFPRHGPRGAEVVAERLPALGFGPAATTFVAAMVRYHLRPGELVRNWPATDRAVRKFATDLDGEVLPLMLVNLADGMATRGPRYTRENYRRHCGFLNYVVARAWAVTEAGETPLVTGEDLILELDLESGRLLGAVLTSVRRAQLAGDVSDREDALALARDALAALTADAG